MHTADLPFGVTTWTETPSCLAAHWCRKRQLLLVLTGEPNAELAGGRRFVLSPGMSYHVTDGAETRRLTATGATSFNV